MLPEIAKHCTDAIQLVDFKPFLTNDVAAKCATARAIVAGFRSSGFIYLSHHGIASDLVSSVFSHSMRFFALPQSHKDALEWYSPEANRGYTAPGREKATDMEDRDGVQALKSDVPDLKESLGDWAGR